MEGDRLDIVLRILRSTAVGDAPSQWGFLLYPPHQERSVAALFVSVSRVWTHLSGEVLPDAPPIQLEEKIPTPQKWDCRGRSFKLIGRILEPCGLRVKSLESETGCRILIRGTGSIKDAQKENMLKGLLTWEHLDEAVHMVVKVEDRRESTARMKVRTAVRAIRELLERNKYNEYKKNQQLVTHAIITGTYRPDYQMKEKK